MAFDVEGARKAGYSDAEIAQHLAGSRKFDVAAAKKAGYSDSELISYLSGGPAKQDLPAQIPGVAAAPAAAPAAQPGLGETVLGALKDGAGTLASMIVSPARAGEASATLKGAGEAGLALLTGMTGGTAGMIEGVVPGVVQAVRDGTLGTQAGVKTIEQASAKGAQKYTYEPRTEQGQEMTAKVGEVLQQLMPVMPLTAELSMASRAAQTAAPAVQATARAAGAEVAQVARQGVEGVQALREKVAAQQPASTPGTMGSVGAAGTDAATIRRQSAQDLPVPIELTRGQAERTFEQTRFEGEMAKDPIKGQPLRDRIAKQNADIYKNLDVWVDQTGAELADLRSVGDTVQAALAQRARANKNEIRAAYTRAKNSEEGNLPVNPAAAVSIGEGETALTASPIDFLNSKPAGLATTALSDTARQYAIKLGIAEVRDGELFGLPTTVKTMEEWRKQIGAATGYDPVQVRDATILKQLIDAQTEPVAGPLYREARGLRRRYADNYENIGLVYDLMNNKRGMADAKVAAEDVFRRSMLNSSFQEMRELRRILQTGGEEGAQAWRELQGAAVRHIRDEATKGVSRDALGNPIVSADAMNKAVQALDKGGKLEYIFGKKGAEQVRALNELTGYVKTVPPGAVNTSNTASVILAALDIATSGIAGVPLPVASGLRILTTHVRDRKIQHRINDALGITPQAKKSKSPQPVLQQPTSTRASESRTLQ